MQKVGRTLLLDPFYGGSHKQLTDLLYDQLSGCIKVTMKAKKWHWRARTGALYMSRTIPFSDQYRVLFSSSVLNLAELVALRPDLLNLQKILYCHENQLAYPKQKHRERDVQYGYNQILSCLVADKVIFNSIYNMESFLGSINSFLSIMPDYKPKGLVEIIRPKCQVLYFPINLKVKERPVKLNSGATDEAELSSVQLDPRISQNKNYNCVSKVHKEKHKDQNEKSVKMSQVSDMSPNTSFDSYDEKQYFKESETENSPGEVQNFLTQDGSNLQKEGNNFIDKESNNLEEFFKDRSLQPPDCSGQEENVLKRNYTYTDRTPCFETSNKNLDGTEQEVVSQINEGKSDESDVKDMFYFGKDGASKYCFISDATAFRQNINDKVNRSGLTDKAIDQASDIVESTSLEVSTTDEDHKDGTTLTEKTSNELCHVVDNTSIRGNSTSKELTNADSTEKELTIIGNTTSKKAVLHKPTKPLHIVWAHRWEHDKDPETFFEMIFKLYDAGLQFKLSVMGEQYTDVPDIFAAAKNRLSSVIETWGYQDNKDCYHKVLSDADVVVSTAKHEFFGVAVLEAVYFGCYPLCPNRLVYPEIFPKKYLYNTPNQMYKMLKNFCLRPHLARNHTCEVRVEEYLWENSKEKFMNLFES